MKEKILIGIICFLVGAVLSTGLFLGYTVVNNISECNKTKSSEINNQRNNQMPGENHSQNNQNSQPPEMPSGENNQNNGNPPPEKPDTNNNN